MTQRDRKQPRPRHNSPRSRPYRGSLRRRPSLLYGLAGVGLALAATALLVRQIEAIPPLLAWLVAVSVITFLIFGYDKQAAKLGQGRVPEAVLLGLAAIGGSPGALAAMPIWHHKTAKQSFRMVFWAIVGLQLLALGVYAALGLQQ